jgi:hypothetical protein
MFFRLSYLVTVNEIVAVCVTDPDVPVTVSV